MHNTTQTRYNSKMRGRHENMYCRQQINKNLSKPNQQTQQNIPKPHSNIIFVKTQQTLKYQEIKGFKHEILWENKKTHTFSWSLEKRWWRKWWIFGENTVSLWGWGTDKTMNSHNEWGKTKKFLKLSWKRPSLCKTRDFRDWIKSRTSHQCKSPKTHMKNSGKFF